MQTFKHCFKLMFFNERKRSGGRHYSFHISLDITYFIGKKKHPQIYCKIKFKLLRTVLIYEWFIRKKQAWENNSMSIMKLTFKDFISGHWFLPFAVLLRISKPAKVPFRTTGSDLHIYGKQRLARRNWQPHHCNII